MDLCRGGGELHGGAALAVADVHTRDARRLVDATCLPRRAASVAPMRHTMSSVHRFHLPKHAGLRLAAGGYLADAIVGQRMFAMYLPLSCVPFTQDNAAMKAIVAAAPWPRPVRVFGCVLQWR